jgi:hypothetical protein
MRDIVNERCVMAGVEGEFSAHSLRAGFVTEAGNQTMSLPETMGDDGASGRRYRDGLLPRRERAQQQGQPHARRGVTAQGCPINLQSGPPIVVSAVGRRAGPNDRGRNDLDALTITPPGDDIK